MANKRKWTAIDTIIVIILAAAAAVVYLEFGRTGISTEKTTIEAVMLLSNRDPEFVDALTIGDNITMSLTEKDSGTLKDIRVEPAQEMAYNSIDGTYQIEDIPNKVDVYATIEIECVESDYSFTVGSTDIRVGSFTPFRGKGYATNGFIVEIND